MSHPQVDTPHPQVKSPHCDPKTPQSHTVPVHHSVVLSSPSLCGESIKSHPSSSSSTSESNSLCLSPTVSGITSNPSSPSGSLQQSSDGVKSPASSESSRSDSSSLLSEGTLIKRVGEPIEGQIESSMNDFLPGTDIPKTDFDWDQLIKTHEEEIKSPSETKTAKPGSLDISTLLKSGRRSFLYFVNWIRRIPAFTRLPSEARMACLKSCWVSQSIMNVFYRTFICSSTGNLVLQAGLELESSSVQHPLMALGVSRLQEVMGSFKMLEVDYKEFLCLRLLLLFNPGKHIVYGIISLLLSVSSA